MSSSQSAKNMNRTSRTQETFTNIKFEQGLLLLPSLERINTCE